MNNNLAKQLKAAYNKGYNNGYVEGVDDGKEFALSLCTVALNNLYGFAGKRINDLSGEITRLFNEEFGRDKESASIQLARRLEQITGIEVTKK